MRYYRSINRTRLETQIPGGMKLKANTKYNIQAMLNWVFKYIKL